TDVSPYDLGTFGSRSTPDAGSMFRATASTARRVLLAMAAERWEASPEDLVAEDGAIRSRDGARSVAFGELLSGVRRVETVTDPPGPRPTASATRSLEPVPDPDLASALVVVTGRRRYAGDHQPAHALVGRELQPPVARATLRSADTSAAESMPGITVV